MEIKHSAGKTIVPYDAIYKIVETGVAGDDKKGQRI